jgi:hypothetical protein
MKNLFLVIAALMSLAGIAQAHSHQGSEANFQACAAADESWMRRFGQYLVSYDPYEANDICARDNGRSHRMGCYINGEWLTAGYYCDEFSGGPSVE